MGLLRKLILQIFIGIWNTVLVGKQYKTIKDTTALNVFVDKDGSTYKQIQDTTILIYLERKERLEAVNSFGVYM